MFNPIIASENIKKSFIDYITTFFAFEDAHYRKQFHNALSKPGAVTKGAYLDLSSSFESGKSLEQLAEDGIVSKRFPFLEKMSESEKEIKIKRPLYLHQEEALCKANAGENLVVTTGTGSGKTECFLLPVVDSLLREKDNGTLTDAVRTIIIYPMNALANDQMKRMRNLLKDCPEITFGLYNSSTQHQQKMAESEYRKLYKESPLPNEIISRERMQKSPPHILITNYSMLEYMMLRPKDDLVFSGAKLRYIVLDEAHIYRGATGIETSLLMRRLRARISAPEQVQYIITSATLGDKRSNDVIVSFAETLCNAPFKAECIIRAKQIEHHQIEWNEFSEELFHDLYTGEQTIGEILSSYDADFAPDKDDSEKLFELMLRSALFGKLRQRANKAKTISNLASEVGCSEKTLMALVAVGAKAVKDGTALMKARYHYFVRALEGAYITLAGNRELFLIRQESDDNDNNAFECSLCDDCGRMALVGHEFGEYLAHPKQPYDEGADYFLINEKNEGNFYDEEDGEESPESIGMSADENDYILCSICGTIKPTAMVKHRPLCEHQISNHIKIRKATKSKNGRGKCPACETGNFLRFYVGYEAATAVLGTALFGELPESERIAIEQKVEETGFFGTVKSKKHTEKEKARQFLTFSDSRSDAAFFASYMEKSYQQILRRRGVWHICDEHASNEQQIISASEFCDRLSRYYESNGSFIELGEELEPQTEKCLNQAYIALMDELYSSKRATGLAQLGKLGFIYSPKNAEKKEKWNRAISKVSELFAENENSKRDAIALLNLIMLDVVYNGALDDGDRKRLNDADREYLFFAPMAKKIVKVKGEKSKSYLSGWIPRQRTGAKQSYYLSTRHSRVQDALGMSDKDAWDLLDAIWKEILDFENDKEYALSVKDFDVFLPGVSLYKCNKCGHTTIHNCKDRCVKIKCSGRLMGFNPTENLQRNHYAKMYGHQSMKPLYIKEHTAQLSRERGAEYQKLFVDKKLHALSSSTTFEMGVDVGSLETVFLRDVPPAPANYVQRAGRAGRSIHSAAYALTYAKLSSHDFTYYENPEEMIQGVISAPVLRPENEKMIRRHINAVCLSAFLAKNSDVYDGDNLSVLVNHAGYEKLIEFLNSKPESLKVLLQNSIPYAERFGINNWSWVEYLIGKTGVLELAVNDFRETIRHFEKLRDDCLGKGDVEGAAAHTRNLRRFRGDTKQGESKKSLIDFLVRNNVLPKYGFPVDTVELLPDAGIGGDKAPQMQRDLQIAVAEYAPGSEVVADGKLYTSRYIRKLQSKNANNWEFGWCAVCPSETCSTTNFYKEDTPRQNKNCISCEEPIPSEYWQKTLEPRRGFFAEKPVEVKLQKPERGYKTDDYYMGDPLRQTIDKFSFQVNDNPIHIESTSNDSLVVLTKSNFTVCELCGYTVSEEEGKIYKSPHDDPYGHKCKGENIGMEVKLSHDFKTDVARITFEDLRSVDFETMLSALYALLEAASKELDIERNDLKGCLHRTKWNGQLIFNIILYDGVAGGAGHVRRIATEDGSVLSKVIKRAVKLMDACDCEPSCYKCLRNYYNQKMHDRLSRQKAAEFLRLYAQKLDVLQNK